MQMLKVISCEFPFDEVKLRPHLSVMKTYNRASPARPPFSCSRLGIGMAFFDPSVGLGMKQRCILVAFCLGYSKMISLRGDLAENLI